MRLHFLKNKFENLVVHCTKFDGRPAHRPAITCSNNPECSTPPGQIHSTSIACAKSVDLNGKPINYLKQQTKKPSPPPWNSLSRFPLAFINSEQREEKFWRPNGKEDKLTSCCWPSWVSVHSYRSFCTSREEENKSSCLLSGRDKSVTCGMDDRGHTSPTK